MAEFLESFTVIFGIPAQYRCEVKLVESIWSTTVSFEEKPSLNGDICVEAAVIGGGLAGVLTAFFLKEHGIETVVLEAERIGSGATKNTTAKVTIQHELIYDRLIKDFGLHRARQYARANMQAIEEYRRIISKNSIPCDFTDCFAYLYTTEDTVPLEEELAAALLVGIDAEITAETELPFPIKGALKFTGQAAFNPLLFLKGVSENLTIYEHTKVKKVEKNLLITDKGTVKAKHIVFASHFPFVNVPGYYFAKLHQGREYALALENAGSFRNTYVGVDADGLTFRNYSAITILGGGNHRTGENSQGGKYTQLQMQAHKLWPESKELCRWSAQDCMTPDGVPYIGRFSRSRPDWYVATGFNKWGMTSSMTAAKIISSLIAGEKSLYAPVFSPQRQTTPPAAKAIMKNGLQAVKGLGREIFALPKEKIEELPKEHGGIVEYGGIKFGVYKDEAGICHVVDIRCPHMGCMLEWNPDDRSWDCPCHGSRYDIFGKLIDNPAQENIAYFTR